MSQGSLRGVVGFIRWQWYTAAQLEGYTVTRTGRRFVLRGRIVLSDSYKISRSGLLFVAPTNKGEWTWPILDLQITGDQVLAELGPPVP